MFEKSTSAKNAISENDKGGGSTPGCGDFGSDHPQPWTLETAAPGHRKAGTEMPHGDPGIAAVPAQRRLWPAHSQGPQARSTQKPSHIHSDLHSGV